MASTTAVKTEDVFGHNLDDFDIWGEDDGCKSVQLIESDIFSEHPETSGQSPQKERGSPQKPQRRSSGRLSSAKRPSSQRKLSSHEVIGDEHEKDTSSNKEDKTTCNGSQRVRAKRPSLRKKLSSAELKVDENDMEVSTNGRSITSKGSNGELSHKSTSSNSGKEKSERRARHHHRSRSPSLGRGNKSPSHRRTSHSRKDACLRNLLSSLNKTNLDAGTDGETNVIMNPVAPAVPVVSKSIHRRGDAARTRSKSMRELCVREIKEDIPTNDGTESNLLPELGDNLQGDQKPETSRPKMQSSKSLMVRKARLALTEGDVSEGHKTSRLRDPTRSRLSQTKSLNHRLDSGLAVRPTLPRREIPGRSSSFALRRNFEIDGAPEKMLRPTLSGGVELSGRSASFVIRSKAAVDGAETAPPQERRRGEGRPGMPPHFPERSLSSRRLVSSAIRKERAGNPHLDAVLRSKLAAMTASEGEQADNSQRPGIPPSIPERRHSDKRGSSFARRGGRPGNRSFDNTAIDDAIKSKLATMAVERAATTNLTPAPDSLGRTASSGSGRRLPISRKDSRSGEGLQLMSTSIGGSSLERATSVRW